MRITAVLFISVFFFFSCKNDKNAQSIQFETRSFESFEDELEANLQDLEYRLEITGDSTIIMNHQKMADQFLGHYPFDNSEKKVSHGIRKNGVSIVGAGSKMFGDKYRFYNITDQNKSFMMKYETADTLKIVASLVKDEYKTFYAPIKQNGSVEFPLFMNDIRESLFKHYALEFILEN